MATETRRVIFRHPRGIYETVEVSGTGVFGVPYSYTETVRTPKCDERRMVNPKEDAKARTRPAARIRDCRRKDRRSWSLRAGNSILAIARGQGRSPKTLRSRPKSMPFGGKTARERPKKERIKS